MGDGGFPLCENACRLRSRAQRKRRAQCCSFFFGPALFAPLIMMPAGGAGPPCAFSRISRRIFGLGLADERVAVSSLCRAVRGWIMRYSAARICAFARLAAGPATVWIGAGAFHGGGLYAARGGAAVCRAARNRNPTDGQRCGTGRSLSACPRSCAERTGEVFRASSWRSFGTATSTACSTIGFTTPRMWTGRKWCGRGKWRAPQCGTAELFPMPEGLAG